ncbi:two-component response regulator 24-like [Rhodamnia argentea]|uniref:Two-component response regulator 24-like n=1 Tax=Rhodamnia argentea TaxID=178133 RepID=A0A8B8QSU2_9MYRT|nr:two-component response regulator 24-like [Rhodamnia argentea]
MPKGQFLGVPSLNGEVTALVVDDDKVSQMIHHQLLKILGIENHVVGNVKEAVEIHSSGKKFILILMDRDRPVMNGIEKLRDMGVRSTISGVSSHSLSEERQEFIDAGLDDYHEKPLTNAPLCCRKDQVQGVKLRGVADQPLFLRDAAVVR